MLRTDRAESQELDHSAYRHYFQPFQSIKRQFDLINAAAERYRRSV